MAKSPSRAQPSTRILGIDPGSINTGWGLVESAGHQLIHVAHGTIGTSLARGQAARLHTIYRGIQQVVRKFQPVGVSLENVFFARNAQSALKLGQARGVALLAAAETGIEVSEYSTKEIKVAVVGYGQATKEQVQKMVTALLALRGEIAEDAADALAAAICEVHRRTVNASILRAPRGRSAASRWRDFIKVAAQK